MDLCTESSDLSESVTLDHLKEDLNLVTDEDLTDLLKRECNEPEDTANVRCAQLITVLSNDYKCKIILLTFKRGTHLAYLYQHIAYFCSGKFELWYN